MRKITPAQAQANLDAQCEPESDNTITRREVIEQLADWHLDGLDIDDLRRIVRDCIINGGSEELPEALRPQSNEELEDQFNSFSGDDPVVIVP